MIDCAWLEGDQPGILDVYHSLFCNMMNGVACCKVLFEDGKPKDFIFLAANDAFTRQTGLMDVVGRKITEVIPEISQTDPNLFEGHAYESLTGKPARFETYVNSLGEWLGVSIFSPKPEYFIAVFEVIAERKKEEELQRRVQERYERVIEGLDQCFWDWNLNTHEFTASQRFELMLGYDKGELPGHGAREMLIPPEDWLRYVHTDDLAMAWESIERHLKGQSPSHEVEVRCKTKSGAWKWILTRGRIVARDKDDKPLIMSGTFTDIIKCANLIANERNNGIGLAAAFNGIHGHRAGAVLLNPFLKGGKQLVVYRIVDDDSAVFPERHAGWTLASRRFWIG